jgi:phage/plasmid primase-like uncharacterized protein
MTLPWALIMIIADDDYNVACNFGQLTASFVGLHLQERIE